MSSAATAIPRRIIQTARSAELAPLARAAARNLQLLHPDWEYLFFDDAAMVRFVATEYPQFKTVFDAFPHKIQRVDFFRYLAILRHGGFYFDLDVLFAENLADLRSNSCVFPFEELTMNRFLQEEHGMQWEIGNYGFGAVSGHPFIAAVVDNCVRGQRERAWVEPMFQGVPRMFRRELEVLATTGPAAVTRTFADDRAAAQSVKVLFPAESCDLTNTENWHRFGRYGVHLMQASWRDRGSFVWRKAALLWEARERRRLLRRTRHLTSTALQAPKFA